MSKMILGAWSDGGDVKLDLARLLLTRMLIQANSGNGKSWALRRLFERAAGLVQQLIVDPEGEFASLREKHDFVIIAANGGDAVAHPRTAALLAIRLLETEASAVLDISELKAADRHTFVRLLFESLIDAPKNLRHPVLVALDEAQMFAPEKGQGESEATDSVIDMATRGRKRGLCLIAATQRISMFHKGVAAELKNRMIGGTSLDVDVKRAAFDLGMPPKDALVVLRALEPGHFYAFGPALAQLEPREFVVGDVETSHPKVGHRQAAPPKPTAAIVALLPKLADLAKEAEERARSIDDLKRELAQARRELTVAKKQQPAPTPAPVIKGDPAAERRAAAQITKLTAAIEELMKFIVTVTAKDFEGTAGIDVEAMRKAIEAAVEQSRRLVEKSMDVRNAQLKSLQSEASKIVTRVRKLLDSQEVKIELEVKKNAPFTVAPTPTRAPAAPRPPPKSNGASESGLSTPRQLILDKLAWLESMDLYPAPKETLAAVCGVSPTSGGYFNNLGALRSSGHIDYPQPGMVGFTDAGRAASNPPDGDGREVHEHWLDIVSTPQRAILAALIAKHPNAMGKDELAGEIGVSSTSGGYFNNLGRLRTLGAIDYPSPGQVNLTQYVMP
jgi:hypothetical protein